MKIKFFSLILALAMFAGALVSCGDGSAGTDTSSNKDYNMTLTLWLPTNESTTPEAVNLVESAINKITKKTYNTAIEIIAVDEDEYDEAIKDRVVKIAEYEEKTAKEEAERKKAEREAKKRGETLPPRTTEETTTAPETVTGEDGEIEEYYPSVTEYQLDIFCIRGFDNFQFYAEEGHLAPLKESLDASSKLLKAYLYPTFISAGCVPGDSNPYAIGNNHVIGEYKYLLINKELCAEMNYDISEFNTILDCQEFIEDVGAKYDTTSTFAPLRETSYVNGIYFWNGADDHDQFSVCASLITDEADPTAHVNARNVFGLKQFHRTVTMMKTLEEKGLVAKNPDTLESFGAAIMSCDANEIKQYAEDYHVKVLSAPRATNEDIYQAMFGVSIYTEDVGRCMDIITLINTDPTVRTILQYGVEGIHWDYMDDTEETCIKILSDDYKMNLVETGNVFMTYPGEGIPMSYWEAGKQQNLDSKINPFLGFSGYINEENEALFDAIDKLSKEMFKKMEAMTAEEFAEAVDDLKDEVSNNSDFGDFTDENFTSSLVFLMTTFHETMYGKPQQ